MSQSMRLSDDLVEAAKSQAALFHRSPPQQIEHWAAIGRVMETALSYPAQEKVMGAIGRRELDAALAEVGTPDGTALAQRLIRKTSGKIVSQAK